MAPAGALTFAAFLVGVQSQVSDEAIGAGIPFVTSSRIEKLLKPLTFGLQPQVVKVRRSSDD